MSKLRVFEAFAGYGSQSMALRNLGVDYEVVAISEIDKYAIQAYQAVHGDVLNLGDISKIKVEDIPNHDLFTYSFPCQDISAAGKTQGIERGKTRSGLLYECEKIIEAKRPKYLLLENVKNLVGKKFKEDFDKWLEYLEGLGYTNYWKVLNAKDYGVPQNRERVFVVSILGEHKPYEFAKPIVLTTRIKDILEPVVDEKYYINKHLDIMSRNENIKISKVKIEYNNKEINHNTICEQRYDEGIRFFKGDVCGTIRTIDAGGDKRIIETEPTIRLRKLTPREAFRLMNVSDDDIDKIQASGISNAQQYKLAGNSIVVNVLEEIFRNLFLKQ